MDGDRLGLVVGLPVGLIEGEAVGTAKGLLVGEVLGDCSHFHEQDLRPDLQRAHDI